MNYLHKPVNIFCISFC